MITQIRKSPQPESQISGKTPKIPKIPKIPENPEKRGKKGVKKGWEISTPFLLSPWLQMCTFSAKPTELPIT